MVHAADAWLTDRLRHGAMTPAVHFHRWRISSAAPIAGAVPLVGICFGHQIIAQGTWRKV